MNKNILYNAYLTIQHQHQQQQEEKGKEIDR